MTDSLTNKMIAAIVATWVGLFGVTIGWITTDSQHVKQIAALEDKLEKLDSEPFHGSNEEMAVKQITNEIVFAREALEEQIKILDAGLKLLQPEKVVDAPKEVEVPPASAEVQRLSTMVAWLLKTNKDDLSRIKKIEKQLGYDNKKLKGDRKHSAAASAEWRLYFLEGQMNYLSSALGYNIGSSHPEEPDPHCECGGKR